MKRKLTQSNLEYFNSLPKKEQERILAANTELVEMKIVQGLGGKHNTDVNGVDGRDKNGRAIEVKSMRAGSQLVTARAKFSGASNEIFRRKFQENERLVQCVQSSTGEVLCVLEVDFRDVADECFRRLNTTNSPNVDIILTKYAHVPSFKVHYIAKKDKLKEFKHEMQNNFYKFLMERK